MAPNLVMRAVVPSRLALISRAGEVLGYNPVLNVWHRLELPTAEALRWLRAKRPANELAVHLERRFQWPSTSGVLKLERMIEWCILRHLLYLDHEPPAPPKNNSQTSLAIVYWICTQACNLRCSYCYQDALRARPGELDTLEARDLIDQVVEVGAKTLIFTGGEPFLRKDLLQLAAYAKQQCLRVNVITNGFLVNAKNARQIAHTFDNISISLDHGIPDLHDRHRGKGSWKKAQAAIDLLLEHGANLDINSVLSHSGLVELGQLQQLRQGRRIGRHRIVPRFPMGRGSQMTGDELNANELLDLSDRLFAAAKQQRLSHTDQGRDKPHIFSESQKGRRRDHCGAGLSEVSIDPEGWVYPCRLLQYANLRGQNIKAVRLLDIIRGDGPIKQTREATADRFETCKTCIIRSHCGGGCRGIHMSFSGKHEESNPVFCNYLRRSFEVDAWSSTGDVPRARGTQRDLGNEK